MVTFNGRRSIKLPELNRHYPHFHIEIDSARWDEMSMWRRAENQLTAVGYPTSYGQALRKIIRPVTRFLIKKRLKNLSSEIFLFDG